MQPGETFEETIQREAEEELGVKIAVGKYVGSMPETYDYGGVALPFICAFFTAAITSGEIKSADDVAEACYFSLDEIEEVDMTYPALPALIKRAVGLQA